MTTYPVTTGGTATATGAATVLSVMSIGADTATSATDSRTVGTDAKSAAADTVTLQGQVRDTTGNGSKQGADKTIGRVGAVLFVYNSKGELRIKFMDRTNNLVYQTPPVMVARTEDLMMYSDPSVSAKV
ncbi:hypothetical protein [Geobacter sp. AOG2]|uniref:hypothetical protein n=1 Tax=Geobacter sp. AOG2 TaxID=1566347 RepID=UPI001CC4CC30|nr:hypothetical protein [Geobacter sp. AOG2]GFE62787.1 hypothetical protein AOG2_33750 [Geobacter sp. AOG2]